MPSDKKRHYTTEMEGLACTVVLVGEGKKRLLRVDCEGGYVDGLAFEVRGEWEIGMLIAALADAAGVKVTRREKGSEFLWNFEPMTTHLQTCTLVQQMPVTAAEQALLTRDWVPGTPEPE